MNYFFDTEFEEAGEGNPIKLLSIGIIAEDGRTYYAETPYSMEDSSREWIRKNVWPTLIHRNQNCVGPDCPLKSLQKIKIDLINLFLIGEKNKLWGYFCAFDYVLFSQLFGTFDEQQEKKYRVPWYAGDIRQLADEAGMGKIPVKKAGNHNALEDAIWTKEAYEYIIQHRVSGI